MPKKAKSGSTSGMYFGEYQEEAVLKFLQSTDQGEKDLIFNRDLKAPLDKMAESIIRRYKLQVKDQTFLELHTDTISFLVTKMSKFDPGENKRAYSYFGTIIKNYLLGKVLKKDKEMKQNVSYDDTYNNDGQFSYELDHNEKCLDEFMVNISAEIDKKLVSGNLNENEIKVAKALIDILSNWNNLFIDDSGSNKLNKNLILSHIREYTLLNTKDIRNSMKKFKELYFLIKIDRIDKGLL